MSTTHHYRTEAEWYAACQLMFPHLTPLQTKAGPPGGARPPAPRTKSLDGDTLDHSTPIRITRPA